MRTRIRFIQVIAVLTTAAALAGCATGPAFKSPEAAPADRALLYVYRPSGFFGAANSYRVTVDGQAEPLSLPNGSWRRLLLAPGAHSLVITDFTGTSFCMPSPLAIELQAGQTAFVANEVGTIQGIGRLYIKCSVSARQQEQALKEMTGLSGAE